MISKIINKNQMRHTSMVKIVVTFVSSGKIKLQDYVLMSLSFRLLNDFIEYKDTSSKQDSILIDKE